MKCSMSFGILCVISMATSAVAEETLPEKAKVVKNDAARGLKRTVHRVEETVCLANDATCLARKAKHRVTEAAAATADKADELKNRIDGK